MELIDVVKARRSAVLFQEGVEISKEELDSLFELAKFYPSCFNLQHTNYYVATSQHNKDTIKSFSNNQHKLATASAVIIVTGDKEAYKKAPELFEGMRMLGIMGEEEYTQTVDVITNLHSGNQPFKESQSLINASLSAMIFMLLAKDAGWDTCPMNIVDKYKTAKLFNIPDNEEPVLMISLGKSVTTKSRPRGFRKPSSQFVKYLDC